MNDLGVHIVGLFEPAQLNFVISLQVFELRIAA